MQIIAPWWLPGGHLQTILPALKSRRDPSLLLGNAGYRRERWPTPDGDFIDVDWQDPPTGLPATTPMLVLFHGLEGSSGSHYALAFARYARSQGWAFVVPHFRGCSGELNHAPRAYHSGDHEEIGWVMQRLHRHALRPVMAVGVSLGGNALLRWAQEAGTRALQVVSAVASISAPVDLAASGHAMGRGFNRLVYTRMFLNTMKPKALKKLAQHPGLFRVDKLRAARTLYDFDNVFTAPLHGFKNTEDYWQRASAKPHLPSLQVPTLVVNALNDPFVPALSLPSTGSAGPMVTLWQPHHGGHVGFAQGPWPSHINALPAAVGMWLAQQSGITSKAQAHG
jgi:predicted alpha/beta-fold hydrolase